MVRTDHIPIMGLLRKRDLTGRCAHWKCILAEYDTEFQSRKGQRHSNADGMSQLMAGKKGESVPNAGDA